MKLQPDSFWDFFVYSLLWRNAQATQILTSQCGMPSPQPPAIFSIAATKTAVVSRTDYR
jgi:hypothetical protein